MTGGEPNDVVSTRLRAALAVSERELIALLEQIPSTFEVDGEPLSVLAEVELTLRDQIAAVWPRGWQRNRDLPKLIRGIDRISAFGVLSDGRFRWRPLWFHMSPDLGASLDDPVRLYIQLPDVAGAGAGARFSRDVFRRLSLGSAPAYRLYLALVKQWDRKLRRGVQPYAP